MYSFSYLEPVCCSMSSSNCCFLTYIQISQEAGQFKSEFGNIWATVSSRSYFCWLYRASLYLVSFQTFKLVLEKAEEPDIKLSTSAGSLKKQGSSRKTSISALLTMPKPLTVWITTNCGKFWKGWEYQTMWPASWDTCMQVRKQQLELDMEQQTSSK